MHLEILVEDQSGKKMLDILLPKLVGNEHTFKVHSYKGLGRIPKNIQKSQDPSTRILLTHLPKILRGYGKTFKNYRDYFSAAVIVVVDLDDKCLKSFKAELLAILKCCNPQPQTRFCFAIEESEAWLLGDLKAIRLAYPQAKEKLLNTYEYDSICGTWEKLADTIYPGGSSHLKKQGWQSVGYSKSEWAEKITPHMNPEDNYSPSFHYFVNKIQLLINKSDLT